MADAQPSARSPTRWSSPQPNLPGRGLLAAYGGRFWALVVVIGIAAGVGASAMMGLLKLAEHLAYGYRPGPYLDGLSVGTGLHRVVVLLVAALLVGAGVTLLHRLPISGGAEISEALWMHAGRLPFFASIARGALSIVTIGMGVSLGREAAPQLAGAAAASSLSQWAQLPQWQRRLLVASGAGAGFAAVYNVPLGGALFALEVLLGTVALPLVLPALAVSVIATAVAWTTLGTAHTYHMPNYQLHASQMVWAVLVGPLIGIAALAWVKIVELASSLRPKRTLGHFAVPLVVFGLLGVVSIQYPALLGNGKEIVQVGVLGGLTLGVAAPLVLLKPLATASCLGAGGPGGLFTPTLSIGVLLAGVLAGIWSHVWPGTPAGSYSLIGGAAFLAAAMQGPLSAVVLVLELTRHFDLLMAPTLVAVTEATVIARRLGAPSIYSARLRPDPYAAGGATQVAAIASLDAPDEEVDADAEPPPDGADKGTGPGGLEARPEAGCD
jgi:CIC family chloride channel protein